MTMDKKSHFSLKILIRGTVLIENKSMSNTSLQKQTVSVFLQRVVAILFDSD